MNIFMPEDHHGRISRVYVHMLKMTALDAYKTLVVSVTFIYIFLRKTVALSLQGSNVSHMGAC